MRIAIALLVFVGLAGPAWAQSGENVAVVINDNSAQSRTIGEYYASKRGVPASNIFRIRTSLDETIDRGTFTSTIEWPLRTLISMRGLQDRVLYILLTKDVPLRIVGSTDHFWTAASVDSELTLLYRRMVGGYVPLVGHVDNPYLVKDGDVGTAKPFTHRDHDIFLVSRLDGSSVDDVLALIDRSDKPSQTGALMAGVPPYQAGTFRKPPAAVTAKPALPKRGAMGIAVADLVRQGVAGAAGESSQHVPGNPLETRVLSEAYLAGASVVEAFYLAMPYLSAGTIVVADPLSAPFRQTTLTRADIEIGEDPETALPGLFAERRLASVHADLPYIPRPAVALTLRAKAYSDRGNRDGAQELLERATAIAPHFATAQFHLGTIYQAEGEYDLAIERFRRTIEAQPPTARDELGGMAGPAGAIPVRAAALNNLAYVLAVHRHEPAEALPLAEKSVAQAPHDPSILDTLAWIEYLLGDTVNAATHIRAALGRGPSSTTILLHAAEIFAASGKRAEAEAHLAAALRLRPDLDVSDDVARVRAQLRADNSPPTLPTLR
jgi:tetratricopeptide (TPR) repeat protein